MERFGLQHVFGDTPVAATGNLLRGLAQSGFRGARGRGDSFYVFHVILMSAALWSGGEELLNIAESGSVAGHCLRHLG